MAAGIGLGISMGWARMLKKALAQLYRVCLQS